MNKLQSKVLPVLQLENRSPPSKSAWSPPMSKLHSKAIADELDENLSAGWIAAGIPPTALENQILKKATELVARKARTTPVRTRTHTPAVRRTDLRSYA